MGLIHHWRLLILGCLFFISVCTQEQPYSPEDKPGQITGLVKPAGVIAQVDLLQGILIQSAFTDSSGYFKFDRVNPGTYNLEFSSTNYGRQILNQITVYPNRITAVPDVNLKPIPEQISSILPAGNVVDFPLTAPIEIEFSLLMDQKSVESNFFLLPEVKGHFSWATISGTSKFSFYPDDQYFSNSLYQFVLYKGAKTIYGGNLSFDFWSNFKTEGAKITGTIPENNATFVSPQSSIYLNFNSKMDRQSVEQYFKISPSKLGNFRWFDSRRACFQPGSYLASNTIYTVTLSGSTKDIYNSFLSNNEPGGDFTFAFQTEPLTITSSYPAHGATYISRSSPIIITFNTLMNQVAAQTAFSISPTVEGWDFQWSDLSRFQYGGTTRLEANTFYTVTIDTTCSDAWGNFLPSSYSFLFKTGN